MAGIRFEWDEAKARSNRRKHRISFEEARSVFFDDEAVVADDPDHSDREDRFLIVGFSVRARLLLVCSCEREAGGVIRILSARKAVRSERAWYAEGRTP